MPTIAQIKEVFKGIYSTELELVPESPDAIGRAESRLGFALPELLREFYQMTSHADAVNCVQDRLLAPDELEIRTGALCFYVESQGQSLWGILSDNHSCADPPVHRTLADEPLLWELEETSLSRFLIGMAYWQALEGGLPNVALGWADEAVSKQVQQTWPELFTSHSGDFAVYGNNGQVLGILGDRHGGPLHAATRSPEQLRAIDKQLQIDWDLFEATDESPDV